MAEHFLGDSLKGKEMKNKKEKRFELLKIELVLDLNCSLNYLKN